LYKFYSNNIFLRYIRHCEPPLLYFGGEAIPHVYEIASGTPALAGVARENKNALATLAPHASAGVTE